MTQEYTLFSLRKRICALLCIISFVFLLLISRLFYIQVISSKKLQVKAESQWTRDLPITAERGKIYDRNEVALAVSYTTYNVYTRYRELKDINQVATFLAKKLDLKYSTVFEKISASNVSEVLIAQQVEREKAEDIISSDLKGIFLSENVKRYYPYGDLLTQVLGFTSIDNIGQAGLEAYFNEMLSGDDGYYMLQSDLQGKEIDNTLRTYVKSTPGDDVSLSIDVNIQIILEQVLSKVYEEQKANGVTGIIMKAKTGEIVAMSNKPSFDLNDIPRDDVTRLMEMVKNKSVVDIYEPGSTFKILTTAAALELGVVDIEHDHFYCGGSKIVDGQKIKCWKSTGHGSQTLAQGFANSCNCVFMTLAERMGTERFYEYLKKFGIGQKTGVEISGESSGIMLAEKNVKGVDLARIGFGQTIALTPIQLISAVSSIVNGGIKVSPTIISGGFSTSQRVVSESTSSYIREFMRGVVNKTAKYSFVPGYDIGGKTGTAQKYENGTIARGKYISSFMGVWPASDPEYVLLLCVDEPGAGAYYGSVVAAPYGKEIFSGIFEYLDVKPIDLDEDLKEVEKNIQMPDLVGKSLSQAVKILLELGLTYEIDGEGGVIIQQLPPPGTMLFKNANVILIT